MPGQPFRLRRMPERTTNLTSLVLKGGGAGGVQGWDLQPLIENPRLSPAAS